MDDPNRKLTPYFTRPGTWAFSIGTSIGWGSFVVTCSTYLSQAGIAGTVFGLLLGMAVILIINHNLCYMMESSPDAGGIYSYGKKVRGNDTGFLVAWFLLLTYMAVLWANVTSLQLFTRRFVNGVFSFGYCYTVFGYDVYIGEVLLSVAAIVLAGLLISKSRNIPQYLMIAMALVFTGCVVICTVVAFTGHSAGGFAYSPAYIPDRNQISQIVRIAVISPWAFIGFENVAHFSEEFTYPVKKVRGVMLTSVILTTLFYILMTVLSVSAYPAQYSSWLEYIKDMNNISGIEAIPAFYAASYYMGDAGVTLLIFALFSVVVTSLIGNLTAISRLLYAFGRDHYYTGKLGQLNKHGIPGYAVFITVVISCFIPFLGRTAIGWIVDVTTIGATIIYGFLSDFVYRDAKTRGDRTEEITGVWGVVLMIGFAVLLLAPKIMSYEAMEAESYLLFATWSLFGIIVFRLILIRDKDNQYGHSIIVWIGLLMLMLMAIMLWENRENQKVTDDTMNTIGQYYREQFEEGKPLGDEANMFLETEEIRIENTSARGTLAAFFIFMLASAVMLNNFQMARKREKELQEKLGEAIEFGLTDNLTGVKNKHAFIQWEEKIDSQIRRGNLEPFAVVVCDINGLKEVNDKLGHRKGDECIMRASSNICRVFSHSPVFRYGGDEFVVLLFGEDYDDRERLISQISILPEGEGRKMGETMAVGMAEFDADEFDSLLPVFEKADIAMYERKKQMHEELRQAVS